MVKTAAPEATTREVRACLWAKGMGGRRRISLESLARKPGQAISARLGFSGLDFALYRKLHETSSLARLAQSAERKALKLVVLGSSPAVGAFWRWDI